MVLSDMRPNPPATCLLDGFCRWSRLTPNRPALEVDGRAYSYLELDCRASTIAHLIDENEFSSAPLVAILAYRSIGAYSGVLGILASGRGYVPLNPRFPAARTLAMLNFSGCTSLVVSPEVVNALDPILEGAKQSLLVVCLAGVDAWRLQRLHPRHRIVGEQSGTQLAGIDRTRVARIQSADPAYLLFTSGSTGIPKGIAISHGNVASYLNYTLGRYAFTPDDRFSQTFDMTFDLSVHDMFVCWSTGSCLVAMSHTTLVAPGRHIRDARLTVWFSVPSVIMFMQHLHLLRAGSFPLLRTSLFCGEPLLEIWASAWQDAAPNSVIDNVYGPTEATIAISHYRWNKLRRHNRCRSGLVPIGRLFSSQNCRVVDGELWLAGDQIASGYLNDQARTEQHFVTIGRNVWYRTGDLVTEDDDGDFHYLGRLDSQVQICGPRVELQEIESAIRQIAESDSVIAVPWPPQVGRADSIYVFIAASLPIDTTLIRRQSAEVLPSYMVPADIFLADDIPVNANGKIDRMALAQRIGGLIRART
jgi:amino acid adenylation domain-containing protein